MFALFRLNYHNQYYAAYPDNGQVNQIKKLWLESLGHYPVEQILLGARYTIEHNDYLPTLHRMIESCQQCLGELGLPAPREAYEEACNAASPKSAQVWSHPAVYLAGRDADWFFLSGNEEKKTWPVFRQRYQQWCERALAGERLEVPTPEALESPVNEPMDRDERASAMEQLRAETGL